MVIKEDPETEAHSLAGSLAESEAKEALDRGLKALIHHLITSALCRFV